MKRRGRRLKLYAVECVVCAHVRVQNNVPPEVKKVPNTVLGDDTIMFVYIESDDGADSIQICQLKFDLTMEKKNTSYLAQLFQGNAMGVVKLMTLCATQEHPIQLDLTDKDIYNKSFLLQPCSYFLVRTNVWVMSSDPFSSDCHKEEVSQRREGRR